MRRFLLGLATILSGGLIFPASIFAATLSVSPATGTFNKGCSVAIKVLVDTGGVATDGTDVILTYNPSGAFTTSTAQIDTSGAVYQDYPGNSVDTQSGKITISGLAPVNKPFTGSGTFAIINFTIPDTAPAGPATLKFDFDPNDKAKTTDSNVIQNGTVQDTLSQVTDGSYTIGAGTGCTATAPTTSKGGLSQGGLISTPSANIPVKSLPQGGLNAPTVIFASVGTVLVVLGIIGVALL